MLLIVPVNEDVAPVRKPVTSFEKRGAAVYRLVDEKGYLGFTPNYGLHFLTAPAMERFSDNRLRRERRAIRAKRVNRVRLEPAGPQIQLY